MTNIQWKYNFTVVIIYLRLFRSMNVEWFIFWFVSFDSDSNFIWNLWNHYENYPPRFLRHYVLPKLNIICCPWQHRDPRCVIRRWRFFSLAPFYNLHRLMKHHNILRNTNVNNHLNETNVEISLRVSITNYLKLVRIYLPNPVPYHESLDTN